MLLVTAMIVCDSLSFPRQLFVDAARGNSWRAVPRLAVFSFGFALPFTVAATGTQFALKRAGIAGLASEIQMAVGLLTFGAAVRFFSIADAEFSPDGSPRLLDAQLVWVSWMSLLTLAAFLSLRLIRLPWGNLTRQYPVSRRFTAIALLGLVGYMGYGKLAEEPPKNALWRTLEVLAGNQEAEHSEAGAHFHEYHGLRYYLNVDDAFKAAASSNKPLFVDFSGLLSGSGMIMVESVYPQPSVHELLRQTERALLFVDTIPGRKIQSEQDPLVERNIQLLDAWTGRLAVPACVIITPDRRSVLATFRGVDHSGGVRFEAFLRTGL